MSEEEVNELIRFPNSGRPDEEAQFPRNFEGKFIRWIRIEVEGRRTECRVVYKIMSVASHTHAGAIMVISIIPVGG